MLNILPDASIDERLIRPAVRRNGRWLSHQDSGYQPDTPPIGRVAIIGREITNPPKNAGITRKAATPPQIRSLLRSSVRYREEAVVLAS